MNNWAEEGEPLLGGAAAISPTACGGFPTREAFLAAYSEKTGRDTALVPYYRAFQYWRLAAIVEGVLSRYKKGVMGAKADTDAFQKQVDSLAGAAVSLLRNLS